MTNITTAFDTIKTLLGTLFPSASGYIQLSNPYDINENTEAALSKGWGLGFGPGQNLQLEIDCRLAMQRTISITLTRRRYAKELDPSNKESAEKSIFEDQFLLLKSLETAPALDSQTSGIAGMVFSSDNGIETVIDNNDVYIKLVSEFELKYFENLYP